MRGRGRISRRIGEEKQFTFVFLHCAFPFFFFFLVFLSFFALYTRWFTRDDMSKVPSTVLISDRPNWKVG